MSAGKNIYYLSISQLVAPLFTYLFWFAAAKITGASTIGSSSYIASLSIIITTIVGLDLYLGMKRSLGVSLLSGDAKTGKELFYATFASLSFSLILTATVIGLLQIGKLSFLNISNEFIWLFISMIIASSLQLLFAETLVSGLKSRKLMVPILAGSLIRFPILFFIILFPDRKDFIALLSFSSSNFLMAIMYGLYSFKIFRAVDRVNFSAIVGRIKHVFGSSMSSWIPHVINILGIQLSIVTIATNNSISEAGIFYIALGIFLVTLFIVSSIGRTTHSYVGTLPEKEQASFFLESIRIGFILTVPFSISIMFFSGQYLGLMGQEFKTSSISLSILMMAVPFSVTTELVYYLCYGKGDNRLVLYLGLSGNVPRIILYFVLTPIYGPSGAAMAYLAGSFAQFALSAMVCKSYHIRLPLKWFVAVFGINFAIGAIVGVIGLHFILSALVILFGSLLICIKVRLLKEEQLRTIIYSGLPKEKADLVYSCTRRILRAVNRS